MSNSCPVVTPAERQVADTLQRVGEGLTVAVQRALEEATQQAAGEWPAGDPTLAPPPYEYFAAVVHQKMFLLLCGADTETMTGGDPVLAGHLIRNQQNIVAHYWTDDGQGD
ncbi:hypothetical protein [Neorhizobium sp. JUb45]|uniref:hypothetical protein n=1 Tax=unclassified Neorhizobium TaxID=2629175 RepID=UPI00104A5DEA|nr:hypothetical protein [Neorhizobium sp. JUb45]TCR06555.1 hypothetical protein EDF70_101514 [Neorhizobium sp. JUb45]